MTKGQNETSTAYPFCSACNTVIESGLVGVELEDVRELETSDELDAFPGLVREQEVRHRARVDNLLAFYNFGVNVPCSNRNHPHQEGLVVRTHCGVVVCLGLKCGADLVEGFVALRQRRSQARDYQQYQAVVERLVRELPALIARVEREAAPLLAFRRAIEGSEFSKLARRMRARLGGDDSLAERGAVYVNDRGFLIGRDAPGRVLRSTIVGLGLFDGKMTTAGPYASASETIDDAWAAVRTWETKRPSAQRARSLREKLGEIERQAQDLLRWKDDAKQFLASANLREALFAADLLEGVTVFDGEIRKRSRDGYSETVVSVQGVKTVNVPWA